MVCYGNKWIDGIEGRLHFLSCEAVFPVPRCRTLALLPPTKKIPRLRSRWRFGKNIFPAHTLYDTADIHPPRCHFERSEKSSLHSALSCSFRKRFPLFRYHTYDIIPFCKKDPSTSLGMTLREYRSLTLPIYFPCNNDTREAPSTFAALLFFMRRTTPLNPTTWTLNPHQKGPSQSWSFFVSERLICQTVRAWCLLLLQYQ